MEKIKEIPDKLEVLRRENEELKQKLEEYRDKERFRTEYAEHLHNSIRNGAIGFEEIFDVQEIQKIQDAFSNATGVASLITTPDGMPITQASNFTSMCNLIRSTPEGYKNCLKSDSVIGGKDGLTVHPCLSGGLWDGGTRLSVGNYHIASWLVGQVIIEPADNEQLLQYADVLGIDRQTYAAALEKVPRMTQKKFTQITEALQLIAGQLSSLGMKIYEQKVDILERERTRQELMRAKEMAESSSRLKSEFLAQISHEIRTPLNTILSFASLLRYELEELLSEDLKDGFKIISNGGKRLIRTIDLILNMSEINTGSYDLQFSKFDLVRDILENLLLEFSSSAQVKGLKFTLRNDSAAALITADAYTVTQIFLNLIDNAIKFTNEGNVQIIVSDGPNGSLVVEITDTGIGMSEEYMSKIYTPFSQEDTGYTRKYEGNGLGLALVKKCCQLNQADINVASRKGNGTRFTVVFPQSLR